jgi:hypothetical protein
MKRKKSISSKPSSVRRERESVPWTYTLATVFSGLLIASGFFFAAQQHFYSVEYGIKNSKLRAEIEELKSKNRRLTLSKETALSPYEIEEAARKIGLRSLTVSSLQAVGGEPVFETVKADIPEDTPAPPAKAAPRIEAPVLQPREVKPKVIKTVKTYKALEPAVQAEKPEEPKTATRSRIIETVAKR